MKKGKGTFWVTSVLAMLTVWCTWNSIRITNMWLGVTDDVYNHIAVLESNVKVMSIKTGQLKHQLEDIKNEIGNIELKIEEGFDKLPFGAAWRSMYDEYGEGHVFDWRNSLYTTNTKEGEQPWQQ